MELKVSHIPSEGEIISNRALPIKVVRHGEKWSKKQLGEYVDSRGVYILHSAGKIIYVGVTVAGFSERFRRKFHPTSVGGKTKPYDFLAQQVEAIYCVFLDMDTINPMFDSGLQSIPQENKALILEQILIGLYNPVGNSTKRIMKGNPKAVEN